MESGRALILDHDPQRRARACERLREAQVAVVEAASADFAIDLARQEKPDLVLFHFGPETSFAEFEKIAAEISGAFVIPLVGRGFSQKMRSEVLSLDAAGFLNEDLPK